MYWLIVGIVFYLSLCGFLSKACYPFWFGLIPIYNLALFFIVLDIKPIILFILGILLIVLPDGAFIFTLIYIFLPFIVSYTFGYGFLMGLLILFFPIIMYPLMAFRLAM